LYLDHVVIVDQEEDKIAENSIPRTQCLLKTISTNRIWT